VNERVHVGGGEVVLLVPGCRRPHDIGIGAGACHPEVDRGQQVELAPRRLLSPGHLRRAQPRRRFARADGVVGAEQVAHEILHALAGRTQQVGSPHGQHAGPVRRVVRIRGGELEAPFPQFTDDVVCRSQPGPFGIIEEIKRVTVESGVRRGPAEPRRLRQAVGERAAVEQAAARRAGKLRRTERLIPPLAGMKVVERGPAGRGRTR
jgi:hypothetical protein